MPLSGPVWVEGARPSDVLEIQLTHIRPDDRGYTAISSGFGLLQEEFPEPLRHEWDLSGGDRAISKPGIEIPISPFLGVIGVAPPDTEPVESLPPGPHGGNIDIKHLTVGSRVWLPVLMPGALLSLGDMHAAQGDGEVCRTALETTGTAIVRVSLRRDLAVRSPQFRTAGPMESPMLKGPWHGTTGIGPDLMTAAKDATREMIAYLVHAHELTAAEAYMLCSVAVDLRIAEVVDKPNWLVTACLPMGIFTNSKF